MQISTEFPIRMDYDVVWGEMDAFGHVNNTVYFRYFETIRVRYFEQIGTSLSIASEGFTPILASAKCDFKYPVVYPDRLRIEAGVTRIGTSSYNIAYRIFSSAQQLVVALGDSVVVNLDSRTKRPVALPPEMLARICQIEGVELKS